MARRFCHRPTVSDNGLSLYRQRNSKPQRPLIRHAHDRRHAPASNPLLRSVDGVQRQYLSTWVVVNAQAGEDIYELDLTPEQEAVVRAYAEKQIGKPYDWIGDAHFVTRQDYENQPDDKWFCSELVFESIGQVLWLFARTRGWQVAPDLLKRSKDLRL